LVFGQLMPELPEVETIKNILRQGKGDSPSLLGMTIASARLLWDRTLAQPSPPEFVSQIIGQQVGDIGRRGKFLQFRLSSDSLLIHLRMSGDLLVEPAGSPDGAYHRLVLELQQGVRLAFSDPRKFGRVWLVEDPQTILGALGPEPFDPRLTADELYRHLRQHHRQIKPLLLDQAFLAGLGNIYTDEALHMARIHPLQLSDRITLVESARLIESIRTVLQEGIRRNGASIDWVYRGGEFQNHFRAYQRTGEPCPVCGTPIARTVVGQRGTHYCPQCQVLTGVTQG
jgi:formamidopyrimidine-DNA glycosylase